MFVCRISAVPCSMGSPGLILMASVLRTSGNAMPQASRHISLLDTQSTETAGPPTPANRGGTWLDLQGQLQVIRNELVSPSGRANRNPQWQYRNPKRCANAFSPPRHQTGTIFLRLTSGSPKLPPRVTESHPVEQARQAKPTRGCPLHCNLLRAERHI